MRRVEAFAKGDLDVLLSDYCEDALLITPDSILEDVGRSKHSLRSCWLTSPLIRPLRSHSTSSRGR